ncbi:MAG: RsmE family RNA methyltransferase [Verrucomicrobiota bacterium]
MNLILLKRSEEHSHLPADDPRTQHLRQVLRIRLGATFYVGLPNGPRGLATLEQNTHDGLHYSVTWEPEPPAVQPLALLYALNRPQTTRRLLHDAACLGVKALHCFTAEKGEPAYARSKLWQTAEWQQRLEEGAAQAFSTNIPEVIHYKSLADCIEKLDTNWQERLALDIYEATSPLAQLELNNETETILALGPERGWSGEERSTLRQAGFELVHLGERVLRTEAALVAGATLVLARKGALDRPYLPMS